MKSKGVFRAVISTVGLGVIIMLSTAGVFAASNLRSTIVDSNGDVGQYASIALDSENIPHISYYDATAKDLKYATLRDDVWLIEIVDQGGDVGKYSAIAVDTTDTPHISYYDATNGSLKYATKSGQSWLIQTVDDLGNVGLYTSIAIEKTHNFPFISYYLDEGTNGQIRLAYKDPSWIIEDHGPSADIINESTSIALDSLATDPIIAYYDNTDRALKLALFDRGDAVGGVTDPNHWAVEIVTYSNSSMEDVSLVLNSENAPCLCFIDISATGKPTLKYARKQCLGMGCLTMVTNLQPTGQGTWNFEDVSTSPTLSKFAALAIDSNGDPHIGFYTFALEHAAKVNNAWVVTKLDDTADVGRYASIAVDSGRNPHICYYDQTYRNLKYSGPFREKMCFPAHRDVPGHAGPPLIDGAVQEDLGWSGAMRVTYGNGSASPHVAFQALSDNAAPYLYLSFEVQNDPTYDADDLIVLNFGKSAAGGTPADDRRVFIYPLCAGTGAAGPDCSLVTPDDKVDRAPREIKLWKNSAAWSPIAAGQVTNLDVKVRSFPAGGATSWNVEIRVPTSVASGGQEWIDLADDFLFYFNVIRTSTLGGVNTAAEFRWPRSAPEVGGSIATYPFASDEWGIGKKGAAARCKGVWLEWDDIWTGNDPSSTIAIESPPNTKVNDFWARVKNDSEVGGNPQPAQGVRVRFRIANWGIPGPGDWADIPAANPACPDPSYSSNPTCALDIPAGTAQNPGTTTFNLKWKVADNLVPAYQANLHQCVLAELDSLSDTNIVSRSAYRNMDFVSASLFQRDATISAKGYGPPPGGNAAQTFYLYVTAATEQKSGRGKLAAGEQGQEARSSLRWIAHGFRLSGDFIIIRNTRYELVDPVGSFGYVVRHQGRVREWRRRLENAGEIVPDLYRLNIPPEGKAIVTTKIEPVEYVKKWSVGTFSGMAFPLGDLNVAYDPGLNVLAGVFYQASPRFALSALYGYNRFKAGNVTDPDAIWTNLSVNARYSFIWIKPWSAYFAAGPGLYIPRSGETKPGYNLGLGLDYEYNGTLSLELGLDYHSSFENAVKFLHGHTGLIIRF